MDRFRTGARDPEEDARALAARVGVTAPLCPPPERVAKSHWISHLPFAFWLVGILKPRILVELGTYTGVSFCAFCQEIERLKLPCEAYAIDLWRGDEHMGDYGESVYVDLFSHVSRRYPGFASLLRMSFDAALSKFSDGCVDLLHLDGGHTREAIWHDFEAWLPKMSDRGVILIHDIAARLPGYGGVEAWEELAPRFPSFAFRHGYGLGVIMTGSRAPAELLDIASADKDVLAHLTRNFQSQGRVYEELFAMRAAREEDEAKAKAKEKNLRENLAHAERDCEILRWRLVAAEERARTFERSRSWRMTAPLRKLASFCRKIQFKD